MGSKLSGHCLTISYIYTSYRQGLLSSLTETTYQASNRIESTFSFQTKVPTKGYEILHVRESLHASTFWEQSTGPSETRGSDLQGGDTARAHLISFTGPNCKSKEKWGIYTKWHSNSGQLRILVRIHILNNACSPLLTLSLCFTVERPKRWNILYRNPSKLNIFMSIRKPGKNVVQTNSKQIQ